MTDTLLSVYGAFKARELAQIHKPINSMKRILIVAAALAVSAAGSAMPAQASLAKFCQAGIKLNRLVNGSVAPGTYMGNVMSKKTYNGYSYAALWNIAKSSDNYSCQRLY